MQSTKLKQQCKYNDKTEQMSINMNNTNAVLVFDTLWFATCDDVLNVGCVLDYYFTTQRSFSGSFKFLNLIY